VTVTAPADAVYRALMDSRRHSKITDSKAVIGSKVGSAFSVWGGGVNGITLTLVPHEKIVQAWRNEEWPHGHRSVATFTLRPIRSGTKLAFDSPSWAAARPRYAGSQLVPVPSVCARIEAYQHL
jgi:activator of HSP90 ATPase